MSVRVVVSEFPREGRDPRGGVEVSALRLVRALCGSGASVAVVAPAGPQVGEEVHASEGATVVHLGVRDRLSLPRRLRPWRKRAAEAIRELDPDVVHGQGMLTGGLAACDVDGRPRVVTAHGNVARDTLADYSGLGGKARAALRDQLALEVVRRADWIVGVHPDWRVNLPSRPENFTHIPNIVEDCFFTARHQPEPGRVLYCGGPAPIKGFDLLVRAWPAVRKAAPRANLRAPGFPPTSTGPLPDGITIDPPLSPTQIAAEMAVASLLVIPSRHEVTPDVLFEAWAIGLPVVCTSAGGLATLAPGAATLVPPENPAQLAAAIVYTLANAPETSLTVAEGHRRAQNQTAPAIAAAHRTLYDDVVTAGANGSSSALDERRRQAA